MLETSFAPDHYRSELYVKTCSIPKTMFKGVCLALGITGIACGILLLLANQRVYLGIMNSVVYRVCSTEGALATLFCSYVSLVIGTLMQNKNQVKMGKRSLSSSQQELLAHKNSVINFSSNPTTEKIHNHEILVGNNNLSFALSSSDSEGFASQMRCFSGDMGGEAPSMSQKKIQDASKHPKDEEAKPKTQVNMEYAKEEALQLLSEEKINQILKFKLDFFEFYTFEDIDNSIYGLKFIFFKNAKIEFKFFKNKYARNCFVEKELNDFIDVSRTLPKHIVKKFISGEDFESGESDLPLNSCEYHLFDVCLAGLSRLLFGIKFMWRRSLKSLYFSDEHDRSRFIQIFLKDFFEKNAIQSEVVKFIKSLKFQTFCNKKSKYLRYDFVFENKMLYAIVVFPDSYVLWTDKQERELQLREDAFLRKFIDAEATLFENT